MTDDELLDACEAAYKRWQDTPRWRFLKRMRLGGGWLVLVGELQRRETAKAHERLGKR